MLKLPRHAKALFKNLLVTAVYGLNGDTLAAGQTKLNDALSADVKVDYQIMWTQYTQKRYVLAEELGRSLLRRAPTNCTIHYLMGNIYYQLHDKKSALAQYRYCVQTGQDKPTALMAARALRVMQEQKGGEHQDEEHQNKIEKHIDQKPIAFDPRRLNRAINLLERAQDTLSMKKKELDTTINHTEEFARSRIKEIPLNSLQRRYTSVVNNGASPSSDQLVSFANYDRPAEVAHIRATETAKVKTLIADFEKLQAQIISNALKEAKEILGAELPIQPADPRTKTAAAPEILPEPAQVASEKTWKQIKDSDIIFMVDMSYSMRAPVGETGQGRWEWAANRIADFAEKVTAQNTKTLTIIECARNSYRQRDQNAQSLQQFLLASSPTGASNIATPLTGILNDYLEDRSAKPLLLIVLTAGHPELGESLESVIKNAAERVKSANSVRIVFVQIGEDPEGTAMLQMLDQDLPYTGAKHDIVDFINFSELQSSGLSKALLDAYEKPRTAGTTNAPPMLLTLTDRIAELVKLTPDAHLKRSPGVSSW